MICSLFPLNSFNLTVTVHEEQEKHALLKEVKLLNLIVLLVRNMKLSTFLYYYLSMFRSFVPFIASHYISGYNVSPYFLTFISSCVPVITWLYYISTRAVIGQFSGPYSPARPANVAKLLCDLSPNFLNLYSK